MPYRRKRLTFAISSPDEFLFLMLGLDIGYTHAKFNHSRFSRSGNMVVAHQNLNGSRDLTTPLSGLVCRPGLAPATVNLLTVPDLKPLTLRLP